MDLTCSYTVHRGTSNKNVYIIFIMLNRNAVLKWFDRAYKIVQEYNINLVYQKIGLSRFLH